MLKEFCEKYKYHLYKLHIVQHLQPGNAEGRMLFCQLYLQQIHTDESFGRLVFWSGKSYFSCEKQHGFVENQLFIFEITQQRCFEVGVSCFISGIYHIL